MRCLLDTHTLLWMAGDPGQLGARVLAAITDEQNQIYVSTVSVWEAAIKLSLGKLDLDGPLEDVVRGAIAQAGISVLPIEWSHALVVRKLPFHHRDPFDRLLIAQAMVDDLVVLGRDAAFDDYPVERVWR